MSLAIYVALGVILAWTTIRAFYRFTEWRERRAVERRIVNLRAAPKRPHAWGYFGFGCALWITAAIMWLSDDKSAPAFAWWGGFLLLIALLRELPPSWFAWLTKPINLRRR
jgi:hypothetical protein